MGFMFREATSFNQLLPLWDTSSVTFMDGMLYDATSFNQPLPLWDTSSVSYMSGLLYGTSLSDCNKALIASLWSAKRKWACSDTSYHGGCADYGSWSQDTSVCPSPLPPSPPSEQPTAPSPPTSTTPTATTDISLTLTVAGTLEAFDADAQASFKSNLAAQLDGISPSDITLQVSAASVRVVATVSAPSEAVATAALSDLRELASSVVVLTVALKVTVVAVVAVEAAPAMVEGVAQSQDTTQSGSGGSGGIAVVIGAAGGGILLVLLVLLILRRKRRAGTEGAPVYSTSASVDASEIDLESSNANEKEHAHEDTAAQSSAAGSSSSAPSQSLLATFAAGPLGIGLSNRSDGAVVVASVGEGSAAQAQGVCVDSVVLEVSGESTSGVYKAGVLAMIESAPRPLTLKFVQLDAHV